MEESRQNKENGGREEWGEGRKKRGEQQVSRGLDIVADGWAGASNPHPHPTHKKYLKRLFSHNSTRVHEPTDRWTNGRTDEDSYKVVCPQLKR